MMKVMKGTFGLVVFIAIAICFMSSCVENAVHELDFNMNVRKYGNEGNGYAVAAIGGVEIEEKSNLNYLSNDENERSRVTGEVRKLETKTVSYFGKGEANENVIVVRPSIVIATVVEDTVVNKAVSKNSEIIGRLKKGDNVEIIRDKLEKRYLIKKDELEGWVDAAVLEFSEEPETNLAKLTEEQIEEFIEYKGLDSKTDYLIWVDIERQLVNVLKKENDKWNLIKTMICATGKNRSPTIRGVYTIQDRGEWFYNDYLQSGAKYWVRFYESYLFHSIPFDKNGKIVDDTLGKRVSSGCIRLSVEDAKWIYDNIPNGTTVFIH